MSDIKPVRQRFYKNVSVEAREAGYKIRLDNFALKSPGKTNLCLPTKALADIIAAEWAAQTDKIKPETMPVTRLANVAQDHGASARDGLISHCLSFLNTDLICYRATGPTALVAKQAAHWDPILDFTAAQFGSRPFVTDTIIALEQGGELFGALEDFLTTKGIWTLTGMGFGTGLMGSVLLTSALQCGAIDGEGCFAATRIEEDFNAKIWGRDDEEAAQAASRKVDIIGLAQYFAALKTD